MSRINDLWNDDKCIIFDGVIYNDGKIRLIEESDDGKPYYYDNAMISEAIENETGYTHLYKTCALEIQELALTAYCGETSWGSEGFVALMDTEKEELRWICILGFSNPFIEVLLEDGFIVVRSNLGLYWRFDIDRPEEMSIIEGRKGGYM